MTERLRFNILKWSAKTALRFVWACENRILRMQKVDEYQDTDVCSLCRCLFDTCAEECIEHQVCGMQVIFCADCHKGLTEMYAYHGDSQ